MIFEVGTNALWLVPWILVSHKIIKRFLLSVMMHMHSVPMAWKTFRYAKMISARWSQILGREDVFDFHTYRKEK